jgi:histidyl-tRNA synthetase
MYTFEDRGGRSMTLRPEGTAPVLRAYIENSIYASGGISKLFYTESVFRYERPQKGRYRQHTQFGVEALGSENPGLDAEVIELALRFFSAIGIDRLTLKLNSIGCQQCRPAYRTALIDFATPLLAQMSEENQRRYRENPLRMLDSKDENDQKLLESAPKLTDYLCEACADHFSSVKSILKDGGVPFELDARLVRGFDYYTRTAFEIQSPDLGAQSALGGGGRYDGLVKELGGPATPGIGFGLGVERILIALQALNRNPGIDTAPTAFVATAADNMRNVAAKLCRDLRSAGVVVESAFGSGRLKSQMKAADSSGASYALILDDNDLADGVVLCKELRSGAAEETRQQRIRLENLTDFLSRRGIT